MKRRPYLLAIPFIAALLCSSAFAQTDAGELDPLPDLLLDGMSEPVRKTLLDARARVGRALEQKAADAVAAEAFGHYADVSLAHELVSHARAAYRNAIHLRPNRREWHYLLGLLEISEGRLEAGIESLDRSLEIFAQDHAALVHRGRAHLTAGDPAAAERDFRLALELIPNSPAALAGMGQVALQREQPAEAVDFLNRALVQSPEANRLHHLLGSAYRALGDADRARQELALGGEVNVPLNDPILDQVRLLSRSAQFYLETGLAQADAGRLDAAERMLARARELDPEDDSIAMDHGEVLARLGRLDAAREVFLNLALHSPDAIRPWFYLGQVEELRGQADAAMSAYQRVLERDAMHVGARSAMAHLLLDQGRSGEAGDLFRGLAEMAENTEDFSRFRYWQGITELAADRCQAAHSLFLEAHDLAEAYNHSVLTALARLRATCAPGGEASLGEALEWARALYDRAPGLETAATLAMVHAASGQFDDAIDFQAQAMFEALKSGELDARPDLEANMARYRDNLPALQPFAPSDPVFRGR